jgi:hypothetical protein
MDSLTNITPLEPLPPPYSPRDAPAGQERDSDAVSIVSQAPSYTSHTTELPAYENVQPLGLPRLAFAPGFAPTDRSPFSASNYTMSTSAELSNPTRQQYENVVNRRAALRRALSPEALVDSLLGVIEEGAATNSTVSTEGETAERQDEYTVPLNSLPRGAGPITASANREMLLGYCPYAPLPSSLTASPSQDQASVPTPSSSQPLSVPRNPHEDPELVGHAAAERARSQRLYREGLLREMATQNAQKPAQEAAILNGVVAPLSHLGQHGGLHPWRPGGGRGGGPQRQVHLRRMEPTGMRPRMLIFRRIWG